MLSFYNHLRGRCNVYRAVLLFSRFVFHYHVVDSYLCLRLITVITPTAIWIFLLSLCVIVCSQCSLPPSILSDTTSVVSCSHYHLVYQRHLRVISNCCQRSSMSISLLDQVVMVITPTSLFNVMVYIFRLLRSLPVHSSSSRISALSLK